MDSQIVTTTESSPMVRTEESPSESKALRWFELSLVLIVAFGNYFISSLSFFLGARTNGQVSRTLQWTMPLFQDVTALLLLGYVLSRRRLRFKDLGLRWSFYELGKGAPLTVAAYLAYFVGDYVINMFHRAFFGSAPGGPSLREIFGQASLMIIPFILLNPLFEELIVRAYLMTEIKALTGSWRLAATASVVVQTSYHLYYGWPRALTLAFQFVVFSIYFARTRRTTPLVVAHGVFDLLGLVRLF